jgi:mRNA-degrading endonuclease RelE of RelBE toxin-antitoxin system
MQVILTPKALKQFNKLPLADQSKIKKKLLLLEQSPLEGKKLTGELADLRSLRAWPYRILYHVQPKEKKLYVVTVAHRQGVYS